MLLPRELFFGCGTALITPFRDGKVDIPALESLIEAQISAGIAALFLLGTTGEPCTLTDSERAQIIETGIAVNHGRVPIFVGTGSNDTRRAVELSVDAERRGADGLLVVTPYYNLATPDGLLRHYRTIADRVHVPIIVSNVPGRTGLNMPPEAMAELAKHPFLCGFKEACADIRHAIRLFECTAGGVAIYAGNDEQTLPLMALGARGAISVAANAFPQRMAQLTESCLRGDFAQARKIQFELLPLLRALSQQVNPVPVKAALHVLGKCENELRLPLSPMDADTIRETVQRYL